MNNMSKHTPGPWHIDKHKDGIFIHDKLAVYIASVTSWGKKSEKMRIESEANAALIAAAPELLEACKKAYAVIELIRERGQGQFVHEGKALFQAISKAEAR